jgi:hypothetical protein
MLRWLMRRKIAAFERAFDHDMGYVRDLVDADPRAARLYGQAVRLGQYRRDVPLLAWLAAQITTVMAEDCGPCTQLGVTMAEREGADPAVLRAILTRDLGALPDDAALGVRFAEAVLAHDAAADALRDEVVRRWGRRGLVSLGFAITAGRLYPTLKYALGHGRACTRVTVGGAAVPVLRQAA